MIPTIDELSRNGMTLQQIAEHYYQLGNNFSDLNRFNDAESALRMSISLQPSNYLANFFLGELMYRMDRIADALGAYQQAVLHEPEFTPALGASMAMHKLLCNFSEAERAEHEILKLIRSNKNIEISPTDAFGIADLTSSELRNVNRLFSERAAGNSLTLKKICEKKPIRKNQLRIGYLSGDFHDHATMRLLIGVFEKQDESRILSFCYSFGPPVMDAIRSRINASCTAFRDVKDHSDETIANIILNDDIDILVDLAGPLAGRQAIMACHPAPITVNWLGFPGTFGHSRLADYIISDQIVTPEGCEGDYSERIIRMPRCYQPTDDSRSIETVSERKKFGLPEYGFVFCSFNQCYKISAEMFHMWGKLLVNVPDSVLWLLDPGNELAKSNLQNAALSLGLNPNRLIFAPFANSMDHLTRLQAADLALDTFPVTSHTTGSDALWAGVPMVTKIGQTFASRVAASLLVSMGLPELVTVNNRDYYELALKIATDAHALAFFEAKIKNNRNSHPLFDTKGFSNDLMDVYFLMWNQQASMS